MSRLAPASQFHLPADAQPIATTFRLAMFDLRTRLLLWGLTLLASSATSLGLWVTEASAFAEQPMFSEQPLFTVPGPLATQSVNFDASPAMLAPSPVLAPPRTVVQEFSGGGTLGCPDGYIADQRVGCSGNRRQCHDWELMPRGLIYRPYLASAQESRFRAIWNDESGDGKIWDITLGFQFSLLRFGSSGEVRPVGWELGFEGSATTRLDRDENLDLIATDYRFGVPLTWGNEIYQVKFGYYHLSSHLADEFLLKNPGFTRLNFSRNVLVWGHSLYPRPRFRVYFETGFAISSDVSEPWEFLFGSEYAPTGATGPRGAPFVAVNGHLREEVDFGGNFVFQTGWAWRRSPASGLFRLGVEYYNGKSDQFSFFDESEQKTGFGLWYDY